MPSRDKNDVYGSWAEEREEHGWYGRYRRHCPNREETGDMQRFIRLLIVAAVLALLGAVSLSTPPASSAANGIPAFSHVFQIVMENHEYTSIIGSSSAPYTNS